MTKQIILCAAVLLLCSCEQTKTQGYYMSHPDELAADLADCQRSPKNTYNCNEAAKADFLRRHPQ